MTKKLSVLIEDIRSAYNVGSVFRSCESAGVDHLYLVGYTATPHNPKVLKTALTSHESVSWSHHFSASEVIEKLKTTDTKIIAFETLPKALPIYEQQFSSNVCLIFGNEVRGIKEETLSLVDTIVKIPMFGKKESLNIAVAAGVGIYEVKRQLVYPMNTC